MVGRTTSIKNIKKDEGFMTIRKGWLAVFMVFIFGFTVMGYTGWQIYRQAPPIPTFRVKGKDGGHVLFSSEDVLTGQEVWQSTGGQQVGSIWGHGALQAPDWSADWLHREAEATIEAMGDEAHNYIAEVREHNYDEKTNEA
eukprot:TRINITY_DN11618_c0_g1_i1.p2 TRINITY_DN11618_c0_g1~~TRINITY_DN11618_c0_g1_i1.p2  ORF type:complete len:141 (-),score=37.53 TRINITY_DN11618_c0_g1_i1:1207-1629(-)